MEQGSFKISQALMGQIEVEAKGMDEKGENERNFSVQNTSVRLWLIRVGTEEAAKRDGDKGSIISLPVKFGSSQFFLSRR